MIMLLKKVDRYTRCIHNISSYQRIFSRLQKLKKASKTSFGYANIKYEGEGMIVESRAFL